MKGWIVTPCLDSSYDYQIFTRELNGDEWENHAIDYAQKVLARLWDKQDRLNVSMELRELSQEEIENIDIED